MLKLNLTAVTGDAKLSIPKVDLQQHARFSGNSVVLRIHMVLKKKRHSLNILAAPLITTQLPKQEETVAGKDVTLRVVVRGSPRPQAQWFHNDTPVAPENTSYDEEKGEYQLVE